MRLRPFEIILLVGFGVLAIVALVLMSTYRPADRGTGTATVGPVLIWGTLDSSAIYEVLQPLIRENDAYARVRYIQKDPTSIDNDLLVALADGVGPDVLLIPHEKLVQYRPRIQALSYDDFPLPDLQQTYIDGAEIFALADGLYSMPLVVDPIVLYANRDILSSFNFVSPPATWEAMVNEYIPTLVQRNFNREILRSPLAFGEYRNVQNAFSVISMLLLQRGSMMVTESLPGHYELRLQVTRDGGSGALTRVIEFYTNFANPSNPLYTWNRSQPNDRLAFVSEDLVFYFGKGSEARGIALQNPNLNFALAEVPQGATASARRTYGTFYGMSLVRNSRNMNGAWQIIQILTSPNAQATIATSLGMAPTARSLVGAGSNDRFGREVYSSALVARGWLSPNPREADAVFTQMVEDVLANRARPTGAAEDAGNRLRTAY